MEKSKTLLQSLRKIPIFNGLAPSQIQKILNSCQSRVCDVGEIVCARGTESDEMYILIAGELGVKGEDDIRLATLQPITIVGEMGMFNRQRRSASVEALKPSKVLMIERGPFETMLRLDQTMRMSIYQNIVSILSTKIINDNNRARTYMLDHMRSEKEQRVLSKKLDAAVALLEEVSGKGAEEIQTLINARVEDEKLRILIVDDEPAMRELVKAALTAYEVAEAGNGEEALIEIRKARPDLVVADIQMPQMDGFALARHMKEEFPQLPVLALSGHVDADDIEGHNFVGFLEKPMRIDDFQPMIEGTLSKAS